MPDVKNVLVIIHGMVPDRVPISPFDQYEKFWRGLVACQRSLGNFIQKRIGVQWGHPMPECFDLSTAGNWGYAPCASRRDDEKIFRVQETIDRQTAYEAVKASTEPNDVLLADNRKGEGLWWGILSRVTLRKQIVQLREETLLRGVGDVVYYIAEEARVRAVVYDQVLRGLDEFLARDDVVVRLHVVGHSLGVALTHDFLFGLFNGLKEPDFVSEESVSPETRAKFQAWRTRARQDSPTLALGSLTSMASQLPLFVMRKQGMIDILYGGGSLNPLDIGVQPDGAIHWKLFYEVDDRLGYATRRLDSPRDAIRDFEVAFSAHPSEAHTGYWNDPLVWKETALLMLSNQ